MDKEEEKLSEIVPEAEENDGKLEKRHHRKVVFTLVSINIALFIYIIYQIIFLFINSK